MKVFAPEEHNVYSLIRTQSDNIQTEAALAAVEP